MTSPLLRPVAEADVEEVLALNERNVHFLAPMDRVRLDELRGLADRCDVIDVGGAFAGFVITFAPGTAYDSVNYRWFDERCDDFSYLDRIVLREEFRRRGLGRLVYDELEALAAAHGRMVLEVNVQPPNPASLAFHRSRGYVEVGTLGDDSHRVALLEKVLSSGPGGPPSWR